MNFLHVNRMQVSSQLGALHVQADYEFSNAFIIVSGENGAGKTTLLRCLAGLQKAQGQVIVGGHVWLDHCAGFACSPKQRKVGCVWTDAALLPWLSVEKNITLGIKNADQVRLTTLAEQLEIAPLMQRKPNMLSSGEMQRVTLARAIYRKPAMLLLDEPFSAQAPAIRQRLRLCLKTMQRELNIPVIMVSHDGEDTKVLAQQHWHMRQGKLLTSLACHSPEEGNPESMNEGGIA